MFPPRLVLTAALPLLAVFRAPAQDPAAAPSAEDIARKVRRSVVVIRSSDRAGEPRGLGSGFVVRADGVIATNHHVIGEGRPFTVEIAGGRRLEPVEILACDPQEDLALFRVDLAGLAALASLELGDSDRVEPGASVISVGNPLGFDRSVARGVVAERRRIAGRELLQVAMPIEPGSSGSPVVDAEGRVIGVVSIKSAASLGFAVPANELRRLLERPRPVPIGRWLRIGALDPREWRVITSGGTWRQRAGRLIASGEGEGFGGRMLCLREKRVPDGPFEVAVDVKLEDESGAAGLVFHGDGRDSHYAFYPTAGSLRLTRFEGPTVLQWTIIETKPSPSYRRGEWNTVKVRVDGDRIACSVNGEPVIEVVDGVLPRGQVGLCKFRAPSAEFRNFRVASEIPQTRLDIAAVARVHELAASVSSTGPPHDAVVDELAALGPAALRTLAERAQALEDEAFRLRHLAQLAQARAAVQSLEETFAKPEAEVDLARAALLVARLDNPDLDPTPYLEAIERLAAEARERFDAAAPEEKQVEALVRFFVDELGFRGSASEYYHRSNSYLNEVLDDREGLPITLSVVFLELARRTALPVVGLALPRHFVVEYRPAVGEARMIDLFDGGRFLTLEEARKTTGTQLERRDLVPATKREIVVRMLRNLINLAASENDVPALLRYHDAILAVEEDAAFERWRRAVLRAETGQPEGAARDLDWLLERRPEGVDIEEVEALRRRLERQGY